MSSYADLDNVKQRINVNKNVVQFDNRIDRCITQTDNFINTKLKPYTGVPIPSPDQALLDIANDYAAGLLLDEISPNPSSVNQPGMPNQLRARAEKNLNAYIQATFGVNPNADEIKGTILGAVHVSTSLYMTDEMQSEWGE
jgi:hypothetical protein